MKPRLTQILLLSMFILMLVTGHAAYAVPIGGGPLPTTASGPANPPTPDQRVQIPFYGPGMNAPDSPAARAAESESGNASASILAATGAALTVEPQQVDFGNVMVATYSRVVRATLTNSGDAPLQLTGIDIATGGADSFAFSGTSCSFTEPLAAGASCIFDFLTNPSAANERRNAILLYTDAPGSPYSLPTRAFATTPTTAHVESTALDFGEVAIGSAISRRFVTLSTTGAAPLGLFSVTIEGENAADFSLNGLNACMYPIYTDDSCTFRVGFTVRQTGPASANLVIHSNATDSPWSIPLSAIGVQAAVTLSQPSLAFGNRIVNAMTSPRSLTLTNSGTAPLSISTLAIEGANAADFVLASGTTCAVGTLAPQASCIIAVTFRPSGSGARNATLHIDSNAPESPRVIALSGRGITPAAATNLLRNPGFEIDTESNSRPDSWSTSVRVTRSDLLKRNGEFAMRHASTSDATYTINSAPVYGLEGGTPYAFSGWVNIPVPPSADANGFSFSLDVQWRNDLDAVISTSLLRTHTTSTNGWVKTAVQTAAPAGTSSAVVRMVATSLIGPVYVDDVFFGNLVANPGFERDTNGDTRPDQWTSNPNVDRSATVRHGAYSMRLTAATPVTFTVSQVVPSITPGAAYTIAGWINIPAGTGTLTSFSVVLEWRNATTRLGTPVVIKNYTAATTGWDRAVSQIMAPTGANNAVVRLIAKDLNRTIYVDDIYLHP